VLCVAALGPARARAWGPVAHRIVADVAAARLSPAAGRETRRLLRGQTLADVSFWADDIREHRPDTARWHYVDIPRDGEDYRPKRDCRLTPRGDCVIAAIARFRAQLVDPRAGTSERAEALRFLVHLIGDLHQPLHCADDHDRGGNDVAVFLLGQPTTLHAVWDAGLIHASDLSEARWVRQLETWLDGRDVARLAAGSVIDWALESHRAAVEHAYDIPSNGQLGRAYVETTRPVLEHQLAAAGVRLARVLNEAF
jgi:S1/P1 Nuclease